MKDGDVERDDLVEKLRQLVESGDLGGLRRNVARLLRDFLQQIDNKKLRKAAFDRYPDGSGWVLTGWVGEEKKDGDNPASIDRHVRDVAKCAEGFAKELLPELLHGAIKQAGEMHDWGKVDLRYQAWLRGGDLMAARYASTPIAKSGKAWLPKQTRVGLPNGYRGFPRTYR